MRPNMIPVFCIAGNAELASKLSERFTGPSAYFAIMEEPWVNRSDAENEVLRRTNLLALHRHEFLILAGCSEKTVSMLSAKYAEAYRSKVITIQDIGELEQHEGRLGSYLQAEKLEKQYVAHGDLCEVSTDTKLAVIEKSGTIGQVIAENFCLAENYRIMLVDEASVDSVDGIEELLREWNLAESAALREESRIRLFQVLRDRVHRVNDYRFNQVVFFTRGIPYGVLPFHCPVSHFFLERDLGLQILGAYRRLAEGDTGFAIAVICDPGSVPNSEAIEIEEVLKTRGIETVTLRGAEAKVSQFQHLVQQYPFDMLMVSSHAGEITGKRVTARFETSKGSSLVIVSDRYSTFDTIPGDDNVLLYQTVVPVAMDGVSWQDKEAIGRHLKQIGLDWGEVFSLLRDRLEKEEILEVDDVKGTKFSKAIGLNDQPWMPLIQVVGQSRFPVVFNNACSSWIHMAFLFIFAGASAYIGTTKDILTTLAYECGKELFQRLLQGISLSEALYLAQRDSISQAGYSPYLCWGHPDIKLTPPTMTSCQEVRDSRVKTSLSYLFKTLERTEDEQMRRNLKASINIISKFR